MEVVTPKSSIEALAKDVGFDLVGFAKVEPLEWETDLLKQWIGRGFAGGMGYLEKNFEKRNDPTNFLPSATSVISLGLNYWQPGEYTPEKGKVSRYAWGRDYHLVMWEMLAKFEAALQQKFPLCETKSYVDTGPVLDKVWAAKAGIGWQGKHSNIINREIGSWFFIANVFTNLQFEYNTPLEDFCGNCTACKDACPTNAIVAEYIVDGSKCISYLTIENKGEIDPEFEGKMENWLFGCDICQDVCPWNKKFSKTTVNKDFSMSDSEVELNKEFVPGAFAQMENKEFKIKFAQSPILRSKLKGMRRNEEFIRRKMNDE